MHCSKQNSTVNMRKNNCTLPAFMTLPLRAVHLQGISPALQDPLGTNSPWERFDPLPVSIFFQWNCQPRAQGQPFWQTASVLTAENPGLRHHNEPPHCFGGLWLSKPPCHQLQSNLAWAHNLQQTQRSVTSCSCTETYTPMCQKVEIYLFLVPELLIPGAAVTFGNYISQ